MASGPNHPARPRTAEGIDGLPPCPEVAAAAAERGVTQILHFTTISGATGVLAARAVKSRARLRSEEYLEHVYEPNSPIVKDPDWVDYVNLSISRINDWMFGSSVRWHAREDNPWVVLAFGPELLADAGVVFATTNNIYPACRRQEGLAGFEALFATEVEGRFGTVHTRAGMQPDWPTDRQAEVLYPGEVPCRHLRRIDVQQPDVIDTICGTLGVFGMSIPVRHAPEVFE